MALTLPGQVDAAVADVGDEAAKLTGRSGDQQGRGRRALDAAAETDELDEAFLRQYCGGVVEAIESLCSWLRQP